MSGLDGLGWPAPEPSQKPDRLALIKKLAKRKKRKVGDNTSVNRLLKQVEEYSKSAPTRTTL